MTAATGDEQPTAPEQRWSPFPVQDWSTMPASDPSAEPGPPAVGPWGPPDPPRRVLPTVVIVLVLALVAGGLYGTTRAGTGDGPPSSAYLPADGDGWSAVTDSTVTTGATTRGVDSVESARLGGVEATQTLDLTLGSRLLGALGITGIRSPVQVWRLTSTDPTGQRSRFYRVDRGVELVLDTGPAGLVVYTPGLRELPADPRAGASWTSSGRVGPDRTYLATFRAADAERGCLRVTGTISYASRGIVPAETHQVGRLWCRGRGLVTADDYARLGGRRVGTTETVDPTAAAPAVTVAASATVRWTDPAGWTASTLPAQSDDGLGAAALSARPAQLAATGTDGGLLVRATVQGRDVIVARPRPGGLRLLRRLHPGGTPTMISTVGGLILVATTDRTLTGYRLDGVRLWRVGLTDAITTTPVRVGDAVGAVTAAGTVIMVELATGRVRWSRSLGVDVATAPAASNQDLLVADRSGTLTALAATDGSVHWQTDAPDVAQLVTVGPVLVLDTDGRLDGRDLADGRLRWRHPYAGTARGLVGLAGSAVVTTDSASLAYGIDGRLLWSSVGLPGLVTDGSTLIGGTGETLWLVDRSGRRTGRLRVPAARGGETRVLVPAGDSVLMTSSVYDDVVVLS